MPSKQLKRLSGTKAKRLRIKWDESKVVNNLHFQCWEGIVGDAALPSIDRRLVDAVESTVERFSSMETINRQVGDIVELLLEAKRIVSFTGAGISASAGIPTYRGAAGIDNLDHFATTKGQKEEEEEEEDVDYAELEPTFAHSALTKLQDMDKLHGCITQNCDNLHSKAGIRSELISDLHGNVFKEYCEKCYTEYERDFAVDQYSTDCYDEAWYSECPTCSFNHYTGRLCDTGRCKGKLRDTIVNFGDDLHQFVCGGLWKASRKCRHADLCLALGSSLTVKPASDLPLKAKRLVIVNLQATELDSDADVRLWTTCDEFFRVLLPQLDKAMTAKATAGSKRRRRIE